MRRREFIMGFGGSALLGPLAALAQAPGRVYHIGSLHSAPRDAPQHAAFYDELRRLGFIAGQNLAVDWRGYGMRIEQFPDFAAMLVKSQVDVIVAGGASAARAARRATATIPILAVTDDMVGEGFAGSLAKPGGNTTGVSILASELDRKRQEILIEAVPGLRRMAALADTNTTRPRQLQALQDAARERGVELSIHPVARPDAIVHAIDEAKHSGAAALNVLASALLFNNRQIVLERAAAQRLPAMYQWREMAEQGGLISYGPRIVQLYQDIMTRQLIKLLRGAKPADLPIEQPTNFELVINLKTAKALKIAITPSMLLRADEVIE